MNIRSTTRLGLESLEARDVPATFLDNGSAGFATVGTWGTSTSQGYLGDIATSGKGTGTDAAYWNFTVTPGTYRVAATWTANSLRATNAPYTVFDGAKLLGTATRTQQAAPNDFRENGVGWEYLGNYVISGNLLKVRLTDNANGAVAADAIRIDRLSPAVSVGVEPLEGGAVVYEAIAPKTSTQSGQAMIALRLALKNLETAGMHINRIDVVFPNSGVATRTYNLDISLNASQQTVWNFINHGGVDDRIFVPLPAPALIQLRVYSDGFSAPRLVTLPLKPHVSPVAGGSYNFPAKASDFRVGEYWSGARTHATGAEASQLYGYDLGVVAYDSAAQQWSGLLPGASYTENASHRIWGKPIYAMADGVVVAFQNAVPGNPHPLTWNSQEELDAKMAEQRDLYWGSYTNGGAGNHFYIRHGDEVMLYAHMQTGSLPAALRQVGAVVKAGQLLGYAGNSGNSTAPHLHIHAIQGTQPEAGPLRPMPFRNAYAIDQTAVTAPSPAGNWVRLEDQGLPRVSSLIWPATTPPAWYPPAWAEVSKHGIPAAQYQAEFAKISSSGYRPVWVDGYAVGGQTYFNVIFRPADGTAWVARHNLTAAQYQQEFNTWKAQGYRPINVESYLQGGALRYAVIFSKTAGAWSAYHGQTQAQHQAKFNALTAAGYRPVNLSAAVVNGVRYFAALYEKKDVGTSYVAKAGLTAAQYQAEFDANAAAGRKLVYVNTFQEGGAVRFSAIWYQKVTTAGVARHGMTSSQYQAEFQAQIGNGLLTRGVTGYEENGEMRFAAFWR